MLADRGVGNVITWYNPSVVGWHSKTSLLFRLNSFLRDDNDSSRAPARRFQRQSVVHAAYDEACVQQPPSDFSGRIGALAMNLQHWSRGIHRAYGDEDRNHTP